MMYSTILGYDAGDKMIYGNVTGCLQKNPNTRGDNLAGKVK